MFPELLEIPGIHCNENNIQFLRYLIIHIHAYTVTVHMHTNIHENSTYSMVHKYKLCVYTEILIEPKTGHQHTKQWKLLTQINTINTLQIWKPKEVASELKWTSYKHTLWKLIYTIQDEHMLSSMDSRNVR